jgi:hypothetical protein
MRRGFIEQNLRACFGKWEEEKSSDPIAPRGLAFPEDDIALIFFSPLFK